MGETIDEAMVNAEESLRDAALDALRLGDTLPDPTPLEKVAVPAGSTLVSIPLIREAARRCGRT